VRLSVIVCERYEIVCSTRVPEHTRGVRLKHCSLGGGVSQVLRPGERKAKRNFEGSKVKKLQVTAAAWNQPHVLCR